MKFIEPKVEIWEQNLIGDIDKDAILANLWAHIARCTRVCYQSEKKDCTETEEEFVKRVILRHTPWNSEANHLAMLEHGSVYLKLEITPKNCFSKFEYPSCGFTAPYNWSDVVGSICAKYNKNKYSKVVYGVYKDSCRTNYITTNLRVLVENDWLEDLQFICFPTPHHKIRRTVCFTTNIGVSREFNRHRVNSIAEESTRYCNYSNDKFDRSIAFCLPTWIDKNETEILACRDAETESEMYAEMRSAREFTDNWNGIDWYLYAISTAAYAYKQLIKCGWKPQQAREVLPLATKTQLIHTAFIDDWKHFIALRSDGVSGKPHPNAKILADKLKELLVL